MSISISKFVATSSLERSQYKSLTHSMRNLATSCHAAGTQTIERGNKDFIQSMSICSEKRVYVIAGAGAHMSRPAILKALSQKAHVVALSGQALKFTHPRLIHVQVDRSKLGDPEYVQNAIERALPEGEYDHLIGLNFMGGALAPLGETLRSLNYEKPLVFAQAMNGLRGRAKVCSLANVSSIAAIINGGKGICDYADIKKKANDDLERVFKGKHVFSLCPGLIYRNRVQEEMVDMGHDYSPEQFANSRIIPVVGSGNQEQNPICAEELFEAMFNAFDQNDPVVGSIAAVGSEPTTQMNMLLQFTKHKQVYIVHISPEMGLRWAEKVPHGRFAPYAMRMMRTLDETQVPIDGKPFATLLGRAPSSYSQIFPKNKGIEGRELPYLEHCGKIAKYLFSSPLDFCKTGILTVPDLTKIKVSRVVITEGD